MAEHTNGTIKTQLPKFSEAFNLPWSKALPIVLLSLRSTPIGKHGHQLVTGHPMHLSEGTYEPT